MSDAQNGTDERGDPRVPVDRMTVEREGFYYSHFKQGTCEKHGVVMVECKHPEANSDVIELVIECVICCAEKKFQELNK